MCAFNRFNFRLLIIGVAILITSLSVVPLIPSAALLAHAASVDIVAKAPARTDAQLPELAGAWLVETTVVKQGATFPALLSFTSDGLVFADEPPMPFETTGHGAWVATGPDTANYAFVALVGSETGALSSTIKVAGSLQYTATTDTWQGPFKIQIVDAKGAELMADDGTMNATRIAVASMDAAAGNSATALKPGDKVGDSEGTPAPVALVIEPVGVFDAFNAATNAHEIDKQLALFADDAVARFPNQAEPNLYKGKSEIRKWLETDNKDNVHVEVDNVKTAGNTVSAAAGVTVDSLPPDMVLQGTVKVTVKDGMITSFVYTLDDETLAKLKELEAK